MHKTGTEMFILILLTTLLALCPANNDAASVVQKRALINGEIDLSNAVDGHDFIQVRRLLDEMQVISMGKNGLKHDNLRMLHAEINKYKGMALEDGTEVSVNRPYVEYMFESDIVLSVPQAQRILSEMRDSPPTLSRKLVSHSDQNKNTRTKRQAVPDQKTFWELSIPYVFGLNDSSWQQKIRTGQQHIESLTCLKYRNAENDAEIEKKDHIQYIRGSGCWSLVGKQGGRQQVSIGFGCESVGIVAHENLHALGLWHEQSRDDRDNFIAIAWDAIYPSTQSNFEKRTLTTSNNMGQPYDLGSTMHYGSKAFSTDWSKYSIFTNDKNYQQTIGQRGGLSFKDAKMINLRYCNKHCAGRELECTNGGYTDPLNCDNCRCPDGYGGTLCDFLATSTDASCGGDFTAGVWPGAIESGPISAGKLCYWRIKPIDGYDRVEVQLSNVHFPCKDACNSFLEVKYHTDKVPTGARFCCETPKTLLVSEKDAEMVLILNTGASLDRADYSGFSLTYRVYDGKTPEITQPPPEVATTSIPELPKKAVITTTPAATTEATTEATTDSGGGSEEGWSAWAAWGACPASCGACGQRKRVRACYGEKSKCKGKDYEMERCAFEACPIVHAAQPAYAAERTHRCSGRMVLPCDLLKQLDFGTTSIAYNPLKFIELPGENNDSPPGFAFSEDSVSSAHQRVISTGKSVGVELPVLTNSLPVVYNVNGQFQPNERPAPNLLPTANNAKLLRRYRREWNSRKRRFVNGNTVQTDGVVYCEKRFSYNCPTMMLSLNMDYKYRTLGGANSADVDERRCCPGYTYEVNIEQCTKKSS